MYLETSKNYFDKIAPFLKQWGAEYEVSDCTLENEPTQMVHVEFITTLSANQRITINNFLDNLEKENVQKKGQNIDLDGNGLPDNLDEAIEKEENKTQTESKKWEQKYHTPLEEMKGYITGENER